MDLGQLGIKYLKFLIGFTIIPTTLIFYFLQIYINPIIAYLISGFICGTFLYFINEYKFNKFLKEKG